MSCIFKGSAHTIFFEDFINELLHHYRKWLEPKSVIIIIYNASFHYSKDIKPIYSTAGVKLVYLPLYSPNLNLIKKFFAKLKAFVICHWQSYEDNPSQGFDNFLE
jgi:transposase